MSNKQASIDRVMEREQLCSEHAAVCFLDAKRKEKERKKQAAMTLAAFDDLTHATKREQLDKKSEVERISRNRI